MYFNFLFEYMNILLPNKGMYINLETYTFVIVYGNSCVYNTCY